MKTQVIVILAVICVVMMYASFVMLWRIDNQIEELAEDIAEMHLTLDDMKKRVDDISDKLSDTKEELATAKDDLEQVYDQYNEQIDYLAKTVWGEARGLSKTEQAAVVWCILNRVDSELGHMPDDIISVVTQPNQFVGYDPNHPIDDEIRELVVDVIGRWTLMRNGYNVGGRVLPKEYLYFYGADGHNHFTKEWRQGPEWDWSLESPYE